MPQNYQSSQLAFRTTANIAQLNFDFRNTYPNGSSGGYGIAFAEPIPEPATAAYAAAGLLLLLVGKYRRR